ncbi:HD domain-containing protein [Lacticaseibacillus zhaodongensis]|uniref:HD domain-containing protein n=1 Tax=Lacticaseibacillus zhaodongensis TaxID=2668065 RepID=UPI0012D31E50|nr:phosphohydrolase [Lacticaseibacillus zhaodongensis]
MTAEHKMHALYEYALRVHGGDSSGHGMDHIDRVRANAQALLQETPAAPADIVMAAATLHDTYDDKLVPDVAAARAQTERVLLDSGFSAAEATAILTIIDQMSFHYGLDHEVHLTLAGQLVQDADRLDAIGAIGIARAFAYGGAHGRPLASKEAPQSHMTGAQYRQEKSGTISHFHEKLLGLADTLNTPAARKIGAQRTQVMRDFLAEFAAEQAGLR